MNKYLLLLLLVMALGSCASGRGVGRIKKYEFTHRDVPAAFNQYRIAFISDLHYKSLFTTKRLNRLVKTINQLKPDILLMGGDYHEGCNYIPELFEKLSEIRTPDGIWAVLGNHDYNACYQQIITEAGHNCIHILEHAIDTIHRGNEKIILAGIRNPFNLKKNGVCPTLPLAPDDFVILLVHTPDYAEQVPVDNADLVLAGHTHGGQVTLLGLYAPVVPSKYGRRFRTGLQHNSDGIPVIITNGVGTSNRNIRLFAPSEVVLITLINEVTP